MRDTYMKNIVETNNIMIKNYNLEHKEYIRILIYIIINDLNSLY